MLRYVACLVNTKVFLVLLYQLLELYANEWGILTALTASIFMLLVPQIFTFKLLLQ